MRAIRPSGAGQSGRPGRRLPGHRPPARRLPGRRYRPAPATWAPHSKQNSPTTRSSIPLSCPHAWPTSASMSSSTLSAVRSGPPASSCSRRSDVCSLPVTPAETGITRSTAAGSGRGTWLFSALRRGPSCRATRISRGPPLQLRSVLRLPGLAKANVETLPLSSAAEAHERLGHHSVDGRLVLHPSPAAPRRGAGTLAGAEPRPDPAPRRRQPRQFAAVLSACGTLDQLHGRAQPALRIR